MVAAAPRLLRDVLVAWAADPAREAAVHGDTRLTYAGLLDLADRHAQAYVAAGLRPGDRVAFLARPGPEALASLVGAASVGLVWLGLNPVHTREELLRAVLDAEPSLLVVPGEPGGQDRSGDLAALGAALPGGGLVCRGGPPGAVPLDRFLAAGAGHEGETAARRDATDPGAPCLLVYTSGSTGTPKGALLHQRGALAFARRQVALWPVEPLRCLNYFPISHIGCILDVALPAFVAGGTQVFMDKFDADLSLDLMEREAVTLWISVPSAFQMQLARLERRPADLSAVRLVVWEGAAMPPELLPRLAAICPLMATNYGMTETGSAVTATPPTTDLGWIARSVGPAFPGVEVRLAGPDGAPVPDGDPGEMQARSDFLFCGYWRRPEATAEAVTPDGFFRTGDLGVRDPDGSYRLVGRLKEMFKSGGYNVYPREVELALEAHPAVAMAAVVPVPDPDWQEVGVAFVAATAPVTPAELAAWCRGRLANYKCPKDVVVTDGLPLLPIGKVDRKALGRRALELRRGGTR